MVKVFFSTQVKRIYDKIEQGVDKYERSRMLSSENSIDPGSILFFEDNKGTIKGLSEMGCRTVDVSNLDNPIYI